MTAKESFESLIFNFAPEDKEEFVAHLRRFAGQLLKEFELRRSGNTMWTAWQEIDNKGKLRQIPFYEQFIKDNL